MPSTKLTAVALMGSVAIATQTQPCTAFTPSGALTPRSPAASTTVSTQLNAKGRKSRDLADIGGGNKAGGGGVSAKGVTGLGGEATPAAATRAANWVPVSGMNSMADLPQEENKVRREVVLVHLKIFVACECIELTSLSLSSSS